MPLSALAINAAKPKDKPYKLTDELGLWRPHAGTSRCLCRHFACGHARLEGSNHNDQRRIGYHCTARPCDRLCRGHESQRQTYRATNRATVWSYRTGHPGSTRLAASDKGHSTAVTDSIRLAVMPQVPRATSAPQEWLSHIHERVPVWDRHWLLT